MIKLELQRQHTHADQIRAVNTFETLRNHGFDAQQIGAFRRPVTARPGAVLLTGNHHQRRVRRLIFHRCIVDGHFFPGGDVNGVAAFLAAKHFVANTDVGKRAAHHHFMIATTGTVRVEVARFDAFFLQIPPGRAVDLDVAGGGDMVGGH